MTPRIPESIESARLRLRRFREDDWRPLMAYYGDAAAVTYTYVQPCDEAQTRHIVDSFIRHWQRLGYGPYVIEEKADGAVAGVAGLWFPRGWPETEIKWALAPRHWGKGYASEAVRAVQAMTAQRLPGMCPISLIDARNEGSIRVALAVGAELEATIEFKGVPHRVYRHPLPCGEDGRSIGARREEG